MLKIPWPGEPGDVLHQEGHRAYLVNDLKEAPESVATVVMAKPVSACGPWLAWRPARDHSDIALVPAEVVTGDVAFEQLGVGMMPTVCPQGVGVAVGGYGHRQPGCLETEGQPACPGERVECGQRQGHGAVLSAQRGMSGRGARSPQPGFWPREERGQRPGRAAKGARMWPRATHVNGLRHLEP